MALYVLGAYLLHYGPRPVNAKKMVARDGLGPTKKKEKVTAKSSERAPPVSRIHVVGRENNDNNLSTEVGCH